MSISVDDLIDPWAERRDSRVNSGLTGKRATCFECAFDLGAHFNILWLEFVWGRQLAAGRLINSRPLLTYAPADDSHQIGAAVVVDHGQGAARVALARVAAALADAGADEHIGNLLDKTRTLVHLLALLIGDNGHVHVLDHVRQGPVFEEAAPADDRGHSVHIGVVALGHADGNDVSLVLDGLGESDEREIVLERLGVERWVRDDRLDASFNVRIGFVLVADIEFAQSAVFV